MGLWSIFGKGPLSEKRIERVAKLASNPFAQPDVRMREMQRLLDDGSEAAIAGVLRRFAANAQGHIADEDEKQWLEDALTEMGTQVVGPVKDYIASEQKLTYALRVLRRILGPEEATAYVLEVLEDLGPEDHRSSEAKLQLIAQLAEQTDNASIGPALVPFLADHSDDVCWAALDVIDKIDAAGHLSEATQSAAKVHLTQAVTQEDAVSQRIANRMASFMAEHQWTLPDAKLGCIQALSDVYTVDKQGHLRARAAK